jgi:hypothetical protein
MTTSAVSVATRARKGTVRIAKMSNAMVLRMLKVMVKLAVVQGVRGRSNAN